MLYTECGQTTGIRTINYEMVRQMSPQTFQKGLRTKHIIIPGYNLPRVSCDRGGLMSLNSLKEYVDIEGRSKKKKIISHNILLIDYKINRHQTHLFQKLEF